MTLKQGLPYFTLHDPVIHNPIMLDSCMSVFACYEQTGARETVYLTFKTSQDNSSCA